MTKRRKRRNAPKITMTAITEMKEAADGVVRRKEAMAAISVVAAKNAVSVASTLIFAGGVKAASALNVASARLANVRSASVAPAVANDEGHPLLFALSVSRSVLAGF